MAGGRPPPRRAAPLGIETVAARRPLRSETVDSASDDNDGHDINRKSFLGNERIRINGRKRPRGGSAGSVGSRGSRGEPETSAESLFPSLDVEDMDGEDQDHIDDDDSVSSADGKADIDSQADESSDPEVFPPSPRAKRRRTAPAPEPVKDTKAAIDPDADPTTEPAMEPAADPAVEPVPDPVPELAPHASSPKSPTSEYQPTSDPEPESAPAPAHSTRSHTRQTTRSGKAPLGVESVLGKVRTALRKAQPRQEREGTAEPATQGDARSAHGTITAASIVAANDSVATTADTTAETSTTAPTTATAAPARRINPARSRRGRGRATTPPVAVPVLPAAQASPKRGRGRPRRAATSSEAPAPMQTDGPSSPAPAPKTAEEPALPTPAPVPDEDTAPPVSAPVQTDAQLLSTAIVVAAPESESGNEPGAAARRRDDATHDHDRLLHPADDDSGSHRSVSSHSSLGDHRYEGYGDDCGYSSHNESTTKSDFSPAVAMPTKVFVEMAQLMQASCWTGRRMWKTAFHWEAQKRGHGPGARPLVLRELWDAMLLLARRYVYKRAWLAMANREPEMAFWFTRLGDDISAGVQKLHHDVLNLPLPEQPVALGQQHRAVIAEELAAFVIPQGVALVEVAVSWGGYVETDLTYRRQDESQEEGMFGGGRLRETSHLTYAKLCLASRMLSWVSELEETLAQLQQYRASDGQGTAALASRRQLYPMICRAQDVLSRVKWELDLVPLQGHVPPQQLPPLVLVEVPGPDGQVVEMPQEAYVKEWSKGNGPEAPPSATTQQPANEQEEDLEENTGGENPREESSREESSREQVGKELQAESMDEPQDEAMGSQPEDDELEGEPNKTYEKSAERSPEQRPDKTPAQEPERSPSAPVTNQQAIHAFEDDEDDADGEPMMTSALVESTPNTSAPPRKFEREEREQILKFLRDTHGRGDLASLAGDLGCDVRDVARQAEAIKAMARRVAAKKKRPAKQWCQVASS